MTPQELKNSILQLAIQGKLVEQRPDEGTGEELYQQIIINTSKIIKNTEIEDIPFDIPESWLWIKLQHIANINGGYAFKSTNYISDGVRVVRISDFNEDGFVNDKIVRHAYDDTLSPFLLEENNILLCMTGGTVGKSLFVKRLEEKMMVNQRVATIKIHDILPEYAYIVILAPPTQSVIKHSKNSTNDNISMDTINNFLIPLPPLAEQKRIVAKIEELLPYIDRYEQAWSKLEDFNKRFPTDMQKSILQMAIQGKLVEQRPEEGTGEELYQQIQAEKQRLIKAGAIKKEKHLPEITEDKKPCDIPESWKWVSLQNVALAIVDCPHSTPKYYEYETDYHTIDTTCIDSNGEITGWRYVDEPTYISRISRLEPKKNDIVYTREGSICRAAILPNSMKICLGQRVMLIRCSESVSPQYLKRFLMAPQTVVSLTAKQRGIGAKHVNVSDVCSLTIPLPPLAEQKRIIAMLDVLIPMCAKLNGLGGGK